uniref:Uncharacterized protein n=1 Tax=Haptolina ericina TaxID=156174 RepID=A0A7S3AU54_9EUKA
MTAAAHELARGARFTYDQTAALKAVSAWQWLRKMGLKEPPDTKRNKAVVCARGCWRLWRPSDELDPAAVVELQLLALRDGSEEAIEACFSHSSPANRAATGPASRFGQMIRAGYPVMLSSNSVYVRQLKGEQLRRISSKPEGTVCVFVVGFASPNSPPLPPPGEDVSAWTSGTAEVFMWELSRNAAQGDRPVQCWMTDRVAPLLPEHGSLLAEHSWHVSPPPVQPTHKKLTLPPKLALPTSPSSPRTPPATNSPRGPESGSHAGNLSARRRNRSLARLVLSQGAVVPQPRPGSRPPSD